MEKKIKKIVSEINDISESSEMSKETKEKLHKLGEEVIETVKNKRAGNVFDFVFICLLIVAGAAYCVLSEISKEDLHRDIKAKENLISDYERLIAVDTIRGTYHFLSRNGKIVTYDDLSKENDSINSVLREKNLTIISLKMERDSIKYDYDLVRDSYGLNVRHKGNSTWVEALRIDSALILLDMYRDRLKYDRATDTWHCTDR